MRRPILATILTLALLGHLRAAKSGPEVVIVGDALSDPSAPLHPPPGQTVRYLLLGNAEMDLGTTLGPMSRPDPKALEAELVKVLAQQGFIPAELGGPVPGIALAFAWGTANIDDLPEEDGGEGINERIYRKNRQGIWQVTGARKSNGRNLTLVEGDKLDEAVASDRAYISLLAFDLPALIKGKKIVLWRTQMSVDLLDASFPDSVAIMLASAAPYFGRATDQPVFINDRDRKASVEIGELQVVEEDVPPPPTPPPAAPGKKN